MGGFRRRTVIVVVAVALVASLLATPGLPFSLWSISRDPGTPPAGDDGLHPDEGGGDGGGPPAGNDDEPVNAPPRAEFSWTPRFPLVGENVTFDASRSLDGDGSIVAYDWSFEDEAEDTQGAIVNRTFSSVSLFNVTLRVTDDAGAVGERGGEVPVGQEVGFESLLQGLNGLGSPGAFVITNQSRLQDVWHSPAPPPEIDFGNETVVGAFFGYAPYGCYWTEIIRVVAGPGILGVSVEHTMGLGACPAVITSPYHIVLVEGHWSDAFFEIEYSFRNSTGKATLPFATERLVYDLGEEVVFTVRNTLEPSFLNASVAFTDGEPWSVYRLLEGSWQPVESHARVDVSIEIEIGDSWSWSWNASTQVGNETLSAVEPGLYMVRMLVFLTGEGITVAERIHTFFWIV